MKNTTETRTHAYLNTELPREGDVGRYAQIIMRTADSWDKVVSGIDFEVTYDDSLGMGGHHVRVTWQHAGEYARKTHHPARYAYQATVEGCRETRVYTEQLTSRRTTPSGGWRYRSLHRDLLVVQLEDGEIEELLGRLNAAPYDGRSEILRDFARELTGLSLNHGLRVR